MMKKSVRRLSMLMAVAMVLSLLAAFPTMVFAANNNVQATVKAEEKVTVSSIALDESTATAERSGSAAVDVMIDGNVGNGQAWNASAFARTGTGKATVFVLDLGASVNVTKVMVYGISDNAGSAKGASAITVEVSADGTTWTAAEAAVTADGTSTDGTSYAGNATVTLAAATEAAYVRVSVTQTGYLISLEEIEVYAAPAEPEKLTVSSIALDAATDSSERSGSAAVDVMIDGNVGNGQAWNASAFARQGTGKSTIFVLDLGGTASITSVIVYGISDNGGSAKSASAITVEVSADGTTWTAAEATISATGTPTEAGNYCGDATLTLAAAAEAAYVRVSVTQKAYLISLEEIEVYGFAVASTEPVPGSTPETAITPDYFDIPGSFTTNSIAAGTNLYYTLYNVGGTILTIEDADATIIYGEEVIEATEGVVTFEVPASMNPRMPVSIQFGNNGSEAKAFTVNVALPAGSMSNPEVLSDLGWIDVSLAEGDNDGYYYKWLATGNGTVSVYISSVTDGVEADISITNNNSYVSRSISADGVEDEYGDKVVTIDVTEGDEIIMQAVVIPDANWNIAAADVTFIANFTATPGSIDNPFTPDYFDVPGSFETDEIPAGATVYYQAYGVMGTILTVNDSDVSIEYNGTTYEPTDGVITFPVEGGNPRMPAIFGITNNGTEAKKVTLNFAVPVGAQTNPEILDDITDIEASLAEGDNDGYFFQWTAPQDGTISFVIDSITEGVEGDIAITNGTTYQSLNGSDADENGVITMEVTAGDVITIQVVVLPDMNWEIAAADIAVAGTYTLLGDVNNDGKVDSLDAAAVLEYDAGITTEIENGDVNGDGETDSLDAAAILKFDADMIDTFAPAADAE